MRNAAAPAGSCSRSRSILAATISTGWRATTPDCRRHRGRSMCCRMRRPRSRADARSPSRAMPSAKIPACAGCHGADALKTYPRLAGQNAPYMTNRLRLWKGGLAPGTDGEAIMAPIARALSERQIDDVSAYFASLGASGARPMKPQRVIVCSASLALGLAGCGTDVQSVMTPGGPQAGQIATLAWLLFGFGAVVLAIVIAALWLAIRGSPRLRAIARTGKHHHRARARLSRRDADAAARLRRLADAAGCGPRRARRDAHRGHRRAMVVARHLCGRDADRERERDHHSGRAPGRIHR